jgi:hypothetical protein
MKFTSERQPEGTSLISCSYIYQLEPFTPEAIYSFGLARNSQLRICSEQTQLIRCRQTLNVKNLPRRDPANNASYQGRSSSRAARRDSIKLLLLDIMGTGIIQEAISRLTAGAQKLHREGKGVLLCTLSFAARRTPPKLRVASTTQLSTHHTRPQNQNPTPQHGDSINITRDRTGAH